MSRAPATAGAPGAAVRAAVGVCLPANVPCSGDARGISCPAGSECGFDPVAAFVGRFSFALSDGDQTGTITIEGAAPDGTPFAFDESFETGSCFTPSNAGYQVCRPYTCSTPSGNVGNLCAPGPCSAQNCPNLGVFCSTLCQTGEAQSFPGQLTEATGIPQADWLVPQPFPDFLLCSSGQCPDLPLAERLRQAFGLSGQPVVPIVVRARLLETERPLNQFGVPYTRQRYYVKVWFTRRPG